MRECYTAVIGLSEKWTGTFWSEPYECGWAGEAILFVRPDIEDRARGGKLVICVSPDGIHWSDEGTVIDLPDSNGAQVFARLKSFGHFLRLRAELPDGVERRLLVTLSLKE